MGRGGRRKSQQDRALFRPPSRSVEDDDLRDYLENITMQQASSEQEDQHSDQDDVPAFTHTSVNQYAGIDVLLQGGLSSSDTSGSMSDSSSSSSGTSSSSHNNSNHDHQSENPTASTSLAAQYPVQVRDHAQHNMPRRRDRLLPGEKKRLRKEAIKAKRAARGGLEVLNVNERLRAMVMDDVDMEGFEASRNAAHVVVRMANCYGLKATMQGSGKRKTVLVQQTSHSALPHGGQVQLLEDIVSTEIQRQQRHASAGEIGAFPGLVGLRGRGDSDEEGKGKRGQRQKKGKNSKGKKSQRTTGNSGSSSGVVRAPASIAFVASGVLLEDGSVHKPPPPSQPQPPSQSPSPPASPPEPCISPAEFLRTQRQASQSSLRRRRDAPAATPSPTSTVTVGASNAGRLLGLGLALGVGPDVFIKEPQGRSLGGSGDHDGDDQPSPQAGTATPHQEFGGFEQHTKGFGLRMLSKMGFVAGQGLGKHGDGMVDPLTSTQRPKRLGLGAGE